VRTWKRGHKKDFLEVEYYMVRVEYYIASVGRFWKIECLVKMTGYVALPAARLE
jgi:hypothetical protein